MSQFKINSITDRSGTSGPVIAGVSTNNSTGCMIIPAGPTEHRGGRGRGIFAGGQVSPGSPRVSNIELITIASAGDATDFGDLSEQKNRGASCASSTRGVFANGINEPGSSTLTQQIEFITISATGSAFDFGDMSGGGSNISKRFGLTGFSNNTRGLFAGGYGGGSVRFSKIDFITISTKGNANFFGELTMPRRDLTSLASPTRGVTAGGEFGGSNSQNLMDYVTISTFGNALDFGDLVNTIIIGGTDYPSRHLAMPASSTTRGLIAGGYYFTNAIDFITIATTGDSTDFGDLSQARAGGNGTSNSIRGVFGGGVSPTYRDTIDFVTISSAGNAADFGNLASARHYLFNGQCADAHGGLGE